MNGLFSWLANLLRMKPMQPGESDIPPGGPDVTDDGRTAPIVPPKPSGKLITGLPSNGNAAGTSTPRAHSAELDGLNKDYAAERDILLKSPEKAQIDPTESLISGLTGLFTKNATARDRTFGAPSALADNRAAVANQDLQQQQHAAGVAMGHTTSMIGGYLTTDAQTDKINEMIASGTQKDATRRMLAGWRNNTTLSLAAAKLIGEGKGTPQGLGAILQAHDHAEGGNMSDEDAAQAGQQWMQSLQPSDYSNLRHAAEADRKTKEAGIERASLRKALAAPNATFQDRLSVMMQLADKGDPLFSGMTFDQLKQAAAVEGNQTKLAGERAQTEHETRAGKVSNLIKQGNLMDARAEVAHEDAKMKEIRIKYLPAQLQASITKTESEAHRATALANESTYKLQNGGLTANTIFAARNHAQEAIDKSTAAAQGLAEETRSYQDLLDAGDLDDTEKQKLQVAVDLTNAKRKVHMAEADLARKRLSWINQQGAPTDPVRLSGEIKMPPGWSIGH